MTSLNLDGHVIDSDLEGLLGGDVQPRRAFQSLSEQDTESLFPEMVCFV